MEVLLKGLAIGFAVAAPVGPIGVLCIKRSLENGRSAGLASGLGAASADAVYGVMVASGLAMTGLLVLYAEPMQLGGGALIALLGILSLRKFFTEDHAPEAPVAANGGTVARAFFTTFILTLSNPMTILAFLGMIAGLGGAAAQNSQAPYLLVLGVFLGSALWWLILVHGALFARARLSGRAMRGIDLISGLVLLIWGTWIAWGAL